MVAGRGEDVEGAPPGIEAAEAVAELRAAPTPAALEEAIGDADGIFLWGAEREWLQQAWPKAQRLRWIHSPSDGVEWFLFPELIEGPVQVTNARGVYEDAIAEWVMGSMLALATRILQQRDAQSRREWSPITTERLAGKRLLVVGPGPIGRAVAWRAKAFGVRVSAAGRTTRHDDLLGDVIATDDTEALATALSQADIVLDALPLTPATKRFFDAARLVRMKPGAWFMNVGRGATVDESALIASLTSGSGLGAAALDVFEAEPLPADSPLWTMPRVLVSPHMCGDFEGWQEATVAVFVDNAGRFARGESLRNPVDKRAGHGLSG